MTNGLIGWSSHSKQLGYKAFNTTSRRIIGSSTAKMGIKSDAQCVYAQEGQSLVAIFGKLYMRHDPIKTKVQNPHNLLRLFRKQGARLLQQIEGEFILAIFDATQNEWLVASDKKSSFPLFYTAQNNQFIFATALSELLSQCDSVPNLNQQAIFDYFHFHVIPSPQTVYQSISKLGPGQYLSYQNGQLKQFTYYSPVFSQSPIQDFNQSKSRLFELLNESLEQSLEAPSACFLSGGLDSSTLLGLLSERDSKPSAFTIAFDDSRYDESEYAKLAAKQFQAQHTIFTLEPKHIVNALSKLIPNMAEPFGNASLIPTYYAAQLATQAGFKQIIGGDGGDELFGGNSRYTQQYLLSLYHYIPHWYRRLILEPLSSSKLKSLPVFHKLSRYVEKAKKPPALQFNLGGVMEAFGVDSFSNEFLEQINEHGPKEHLIRYFDQIDGQSIMNKMMGLDLKLVLADNDLIKTRLACETAGIKLGLPFLSDALLDFSCHLPESQKIKGSQLRIFYKKAMKDYLPKPIINKRKHGFGMPFGEWLVTNRELQAFSMDYLMDFKKRGVFKAKALDELSNNLLHQYPSYYGTLVWVIMTLECFLQQQHIKSFRFETNEKVDKETV